MPLLRTRRPERPKGSRRLRMTVVVPVAVLGLIAAAGATASRPGPAAAAGNGRLVLTADGWVQGKTAGSTDEYLGIPYAAPPAGALRWRPPQPAARWGGVREAVSYAPHCPQPPSGFGIASTSENCLYLNVFTPAGRAGRNLPVMVWLHGGSFLVGESDDYNPAALVRDGVVVVTVNYRLGALGFLADAALAGRPGDASGDYGLEDQQAALRWVQRNIGRFGGDPRNVPMITGTWLNWPLATGTAQRTLSLVPSGPEIETDYAAEHHCAFWAAVS
jgi:para-nitrobenzyl esterase